METKKHKHSDNEKDIPNQFGKKVVHDSNVEKGLPIRDIELDLQGIEGIAPTTAKKLNEAEDSTRAEKKPEGGAD